MHHLLSVRHLTERHSAKGSRPLYIVQVDFEKAFDRVPRATLWKRLAERGVSGRMLAALEKAYERVEMRVKSDGELGEVFVSRQGVKQGCPLSTELFGLFIEAFADYLDALDSARARESAGDAADTPSYSLLRRPVPAKLHAMRPSRCGTRAYPSLRKVACVI